MSLVSNGRQTERQKVRKCKRRDMGGVFLLKNLKSFIGNLTKIIQYIMSDSTANRIEVFLYNKTQFLLG